ncbi:MAG: phosphoribosyltransferase family protein [Acidobacteriota bacterium]
MKPVPLFRNRREAGRALARRVRERVHEKDCLVLALPRGGVPVGFEVALALAAELDAFLVRKLGLPGDEELAVGAIASGGVRVLNHDLIQELNLSPRLIDEITARELRELHRREAMYRVSRPRAEVRNRTVILVDDGLATGATMLAACRALAQQAPATLVVAVPVAAARTCDRFRAEADLVICLETPEPFSSVGRWYEDFTQTSDEEVRALLARAAGRQGRLTAGFPESRGY